MKKKYIIVFNQVNQSVYEVEAYNPIQADKIARKLWKKGHKEPVCIEVSSYHYSKVLGETWKILEWVLK